MNPFTKVFVAGCLISLVGTLPFGVLNLTAFRISHQEGIQQALLFATGVTLIEVIYLRITLLSSRWLEKHQWLNRLHWLSIVILLSLAISCFWSIYFTPVNALPETKYTFNSFLQGIFLSAMNPLQIPFWMGWNAILISKEVLQTDNKHYHAYSLGAGSGTFLGLTIFAISGWLVKGNSFFSPTLLNAALGILYVACAAIQVMKLFKMKIAQQQ